MSTRSTHEDRVTALAERLRRGYRRLELRRAYIPLDQERRLSRLGKLSDRSVAQIIKGSAEAAGFPFHSVLRSQPAGAVPSNGCSLVIARQARGALFPLLRGDGATTFLRG